MDCRPPPGASRRPPPFRQGHRIWKKPRRSKVLGAERIERAQQLFAFRFWSVPDPILWRGSSHHVPHCPKPRKGLQNFHMRWPCPLGGGLGWGVQACLGARSPPPCPCPTRGGGRQRRT